jgi:hypothetical protein
MDQDYVKSKSLVRKIDYLVYPPLLSIMVHKIHTTYEQGRTWGGAEGAAVPGPQKQRAP